MDVDTLLIAETDPGILHTLSHVLSNRLPHIDIHVATSADEAHQKLSQVRYAASVVAPHLVEGTKSLRLHKVQNRSVLMPVILTATKASMEASRKALLCRGAFDVITKPVHPTEALSSIRGALWHARLLRLLTQRDRVLESLNRHIEAYPKELRVRGVMENTVESIEATFTAVRESMVLIEPGSDHDQLFIDLAVSIQERTKDLALDRLNRLISVAR